MHRTKKSLNNIERMLATREKWQNKQGNDYGAADND